LLEPVKLATEPVVHQQFVIPRVDSLVLDEDEAACWHVVVVVVVVVVDHVGAGAGFHGRVVDVDELKLAAVRVAKHMDVTVGSLAPLTEDQRIGTESRRRIVVDHRLLVGLRDDAGQVDGVARTGCQSGR
jgi:hypothetical protein